MALKRLDEEFDLKAGTQLLPYMRRLLPSLESRFQGLEATALIYAKVMEDIRAAALMRMNEILIPATEDILAVTKLGFLLVPISTPYKFVVGYMAVYVDDCPQRSTFTPSPYLLIEHTNVDYAIARLMSYDQATGLLEMTVTAVHGNMDSQTDLMVSSTPGMADSTKTYHDAIAPMHAEVQTDYDEIVTMHQEILDAASALEGAGIDLYNYIKNDGSTPFLAVQHGVSPVVGSNDNTIATTAWSRARMQEYAAGAVLRSGDTMTGVLTLSGPPSQPAHAATKSYVDGLMTQGATINGVLTIQTTNPTLRLQSAGTQQSRMIESRSSNGFIRWVLTLGDGSTETGGNAGSNFVLTRYNDTGAIIDSPLTINRASGVASFGSAAFGSASFASAAVQALSYSTSFSGVGDMNVVGDMGVYRAGSVNTGVLYFGQARGAYHYFDGTNHNLYGGGLKVGGLSVDGTQAVFSVPIVSNGQVIYPNVPINGQSNYWTVAADGGKAIAGTGSIVINSGVHPVGTCITFIGYGGAMSIQCSGNTVYWISPSGLTSGNRSLPDRGVATAIRTADGNWVIGGTGMT